MKKLFFLFLIYMPFLSACDSKIQKMGNFVNAFNRSSSALPKELLRGAHASIISSSEIKIVFYTNVSFTDEPKQEMYKQLFPKITAELFNREPMFQKIINMGVTFTIALYTANNSFFHEFQLDSEKFHELIKTKQKKVTSTQHVGNNNSGELREILKSLNESLPIEDKRTGSKTLKVEINQQNEIVYTIEVPKDYKDFFKDQDSKEVLRDELLRKEDVKQILRMAKQFNINVLRYIYIDKTGNKIGEISTKK